MKNINLIESFFFIRYNKPYFHLRIRFFVSKNNDIYVIIKNMSIIVDNLYKEKKIWKIEIDTYTREVERYEAVPINIAELFFYKESFFLCEILKRIKNHENIWHTVIWSIDTYLSCCNFDIQSKIDYVEAVGNSYKKEFGFNIHNSKSLSNVYRDNKLIVQKILENEFEDEEWNNLSRIKKSHKSFCMDFFHFINNEKNINVKIKFIQSIIHMLNNRAFIYYNRLHEMIMYDFLLMFYKSKSARSLSDN